jgi:hypothetical protein
MLNGEIFLDGNVPAEDEEFLLKGLTACGVNGRARIIPTRRDPATLTWIVLIALPLQGFLSTLGTKIAEDGHTWLSKLVNRLNERPHPPTAEAAASTARLLVLQDEATGLQIVLEPDLPRDAYDQLLILDLSGIRLGPVHYDRTQRRWRSELNEAQVTE